MRLHVAHGQAPLAPLLEQIGAKTADAGHEVGEVRFTFLLHPFAQMGRRNLLDDVVQPFLGRKRAFDGDQVAVDAEDDRSADLQVNVRCPAIDSRLQNTMKYFHIWQSTESGRGTKDENATGRNVTSPSRASGPGLAQACRSSTLKALNASAAATPPPTSATR